MSKMVYADNAATTRLSETALKAMLPWLEGGFGNPSSVYKLGRDAKRALDEARDKVSAALGARPEEIYFTGSGTEADNWAIRGIAAARSERGRHIITTSVEHHAVSHTLEELEKAGFEVTYLPVNQLGQISPEQLRAAIRQDTILITIMFANNEIGNIYPIAELGAIARERGVVFHTDAVQAVGHIPIDVEEMNIDMLSLSAHKFRGPKGVGALYVKRGIQLPGFITGGAQERGRRGGTENVAGICGMSAALEEATGHLEENREYITRLRDKLICGIKDIPRCRLTGDPVNRLPGSASFVFDCVEGEAIILSLDREGICASSGSACSSGSLDPSHVLLAIGLPYDIAHSSVRLSLSEDNTQQDVDYILEKLPSILERLRAMSPLWEDKIR